MEVLPIILVLHRDIFSRQRLLMEIPGNQPILYIWPIQKCPLYGGNAAGGLISWEINYRPFKGNTLFLGLKNILSCVYSRIAGILKGSKFLYTETRISCLRCMESIYTEVMEAHGNQVRLTDIRFCPVDFAVNSNGFILSEFFNQKDRQLT